MKGCFFYSIFQEVYGYHTLQKLPDKTLQKVSYTNTILIKIDYNVCKCNGPIGVVTHSDTRNCPGGPEVTRVSPKYYPGLPGREHYLGYLPGIMYYFLDVKSSIQHTSIPLGLARVSN